MSEPKAAGSTWLQRLLMGSLMVSIGLAVIAGLALMVIDPERDVLARRLFAMMLLMVCFGAMLAAETARTRLRRFELVMVLSMLATAMGTAMCLRGMFLPRAAWNAPEESLVKLGTTVLMAGVAVAHTGALSLVRTRLRLLLGLKIAVMACTWVLVGLVTAAMFGEEWLETAFGRGFGLIIMIFMVGSLLAFGTVIGTIAVAIAAFSPANREIPPVESVASKLTLELGCPKCGHGQSLRTGHGRCAECGAGLFIEVEEPRCACGYLLYQLKGDTCPECGRSIPPEDRWAAARSSPLP